MKSLFKKISAIKDIFMFILINITIFFIGCDGNPFFGMGTESDVKPPAISITSPNNTDFVGANFHVKGTASDDQGLKSITLYVEGTAYSKEITSSLSKWDIQVDTTTITSNNYKIKVKATDKANKTSFAYVNITLDKDGPTINLYSPELTSDENATTRLTGVINFIVYPSDNMGVSQISTNNKLTIYKRGSTNIIYSTVITFNSETKLFDPVIFDTMDYPEENAELVITFEDNLGNISEFRRYIELKHEENIPSIYIESPSENANIPKWLSITGYAIDNKEVSKVYWNIKKSDLSYVYSTFREIIPSGPVAYFNFYKTIDIDNLPDGGGNLETGYYWLSVYAKDNEGNISPLKDVKFNIDTTLPVITILDSTTTPVGGTPLVASYLNTNFEIEVKCSTPSLDYMRYKITQNLGIPKDTGWNPFGVMDQSVDIYSKIVNINTLKTTYNFSDGLITITFEAKKDTKISNISRIFYIDTTPPVLTVISHNNGDSVNGAVTLTGSAYDAQGLEGAIKIYKPAPFDTTYDATGQSIWSYVLSTDSNFIETQFGIPDDSSDDKTFRIQAIDKADNKTTINLTLSIDPTKDKPTITLLIPNSSGKKVSGMLSVLAVMSDDDYPGKTMSANLRVYEMPSLTLIPSLNKDYTSATPGFPNLTTTIDTSTLNDGTTYRIKINGTDWHGKQASEVVCDFIVDKSIPNISLITPANNDYKTTNIRFQGNVNDNNLIDALYLSYLDDTNNNKNVEVNLTPSTPFVPGNYNYTFDCTLDSTTSGSGFVSGDGINWSNNEWGNSPHLFTLRAIDETGLIGYQYRMINLDNNTPTVSITEPENGTIIGYGSSNIDIKGSINDNPPEGTSYSLGLGDYKIDLYKGGVFHTNIKAYGSTANSSGTAASWITTWTYDPLLPDATDYQIRVWARDNAGHESTVAIVNIEKNANPPFVNSAIIVSPRSYYKGTIQIQVDAQDTGSAPANGIDVLQLLVNDTIVDTYDPPGEPLTLTYTFNYNTDSTSDGLKKVEVRVRDINTLSTNTKLVGNIVFDNTNPTISAPTFYTLGYSSPITGYSTYLGFTVEVNDVWSLVGDNPQFKLGTTSGGNEILDWSYFPTISWDGQTRYVATFDNWIDVSSYSTRLYLTIKSTDSAGNQIINTSYYIDQASGIPNVNITGAVDSFKSDMLDSNPGDGKTEISGTVSVSGQDKIWIREGIGSEVEVSNYSGGTTFSHLFNNSELSNSNLKFRVRVSKNGIQKMVEKTFYIDNEPPVVTINSTVNAKSNEGYVSSNDLSGKVIFSGTYTDNYQNMITDKNDIELQINIDNQGWVNVPINNIITNPYPSLWTWTYEYDTETHPDMVKNNISIQVRAKDLAANLVTSTPITKNIKPYITELEAINQDSSGNSATRPVYEVKWYSSGEWANHNKRRWTIGQDSRFKIKGYNLKQGSTSPEVYLGTFSMPIVSSSKNEIVVTMGTNDTNNKSNNLYVRAKPSNIDSSNITLYVFRFAKVGNDYDTYDVRDFGMSLMADGYAFITFSRDHQIQPYYAKPKNGSGFAPDDYSTYRMKEAATYPSNQANAYNSGGWVDPIWFALNEVYDTGATRYYLAFCNDERGIGPTRLGHSTLNDTTNYHTQLAGGSNEGPYYNINSIDTIKNASLKLVKSGGGNGRIYLAMYNDDSRAVPPVPRIRFHTRSITNFTTFGTLREFEVYSTNRPGKWLSVDTIVSSGVPIISFWTETNNKLNLMYSDIVEPTGAANFTGGGRLRTGLKDGGKYNSIIVGASDMIHISYQDLNQNLSYSVLQGAGDTLSDVTIEQKSIEGITGVNTSICLDNNNRPYIAYQNYTQLNLPKALHLARFVGSTVTKANLSNVLNWEYMEIPSPVAVNPSQRIIIKWYSGTVQIPVIAYKGNNFIYIARLIQ